MTERIFTPAEAVTFLNEELNAKVALATLAWKRSHGGGPQYARVFNRIEYTESDLRAWVEAERNQKYTSTAEETSAA